MSFIILFFNKRVLESCESKADRAGPGLEGRISFSYFIEIWFCNIFMLASVVVSLVTDGYIYKPWKTGIKDILS